MSLSTFNRAIPAHLAGYPRLEVNGNFAQFMKVLTPAIKMVAPNVAKTLETGKALVFIKPDLDRTITLGRQQATNHPLVFDTLTPEQQALPVFLADGSNIPLELLCTHQDVMFFYSTIRKPEYFGEAGKSKYELLLKTIAYNEEKYYTKELPAAFSIIVQLLSPGVQSKLEIPRDVWLAKRNDNDVAWLLKKLEEVTLGGGVRAVGQSLLSLTQLHMKMFDHDFVRYSQAFNESREKLTIAFKTMPPNTDFIEILCNVLYTFGLSQSNNQFIKLRIQNNLSMNQFASVDTLQNELMLMLSNYEGIMNVSNGEQGVLYNANIVSKKFNRTSAAIIKCFNCWRDGHRVSECNYPTATCGICKIKGHCTKAHDKATAAIQRRQNQAPQFSSKNPAKDSPSAMIARQNKQPVKRVQFKPVQAHNTLIDSEEVDHFDSDTYDQLFLQDDLVNMDESCQSYNTTVEQLDEINENELQSENEEPVDHDFSDNDSYEVHGYLAIVHVGPETPVFNFMHYDQGPIDNDISSALLFDQRQLHLDTLNNPQPLPVFQFGQQSVMSDLGHQISNISLLFDTVEVPAQGYTFLDSSPIMANQKVTVAVPTVAQNLIPPPPVFFKFFYMAILRGNIFPILN